MLSLFPADAPLPAPLTAYDPTMALPDFADRVARLRSWQQRIASGYVGSQKEEALQAEFLNLVFGQALGYEHERPDYRQLLLEKKTNVDGTKPDGALGDFAADGKGALSGPVRVVVELKDARTNLDAKQKLGAKGRAETPVEQAFSYPSKMGASCRWVVVSNFVELRLYAANDQTRAEVFRLDTLPDQPAQLRRFFALLAAGQVLPLPTQPDAPLDLALRQRQEQEARISKEFYRDYRAARRALLDHLIEQNPAVAPLALLEHTQKLLDRVIFVCFCEDKNIIPRLTFRRLLDAVRANVFDPADDKIYRTVRGLFQSIDLGNKAANINRFNGGLFAPDAALDALVIKDRTLGPVISLEQYDFASELNVNILGHIFEQSLADLEAERARLLGEAPPPAKQGKRKQDGIFYTPDYITRYIVGQAVGGWLRERRQEAGLDALPDLTDADRATIGVNQQTKRLLAPSRNVQRHLGAWEAYGQRLRAIRVLDPACGSGAFLNEAFGYLLREGQVVNDALAELRAGQRELFDLDRHILQHNLYGVDLNPESVQITRLSLWLQTANPGRPLTSLDHSIRCGNSLIADPAVAGDRAFDWPAAFPEVFEAGGFDVVVGNPPYVRQELISNIKPSLQKDFEVYFSTADLYTYFFELGLRILNNFGRLSYITPNKFMRANYGSALRYYLSKFSIEQIIDFGELPVFADAATFPAITTISKVVAQPSSVVSFSAMKRIDTSQLAATVAEVAIAIPVERLTMESWDFSSTGEQIIWEKMRQIGVPLKQYIKSIKRGLLTGFNEAFVIDAITRDALIKADSKSEEVIKPYAIGDDVRKYRIEYKDKFIILSKLGINIEHYPAIFNHLKQYQLQLEKRSDKGKHWWELRSCDYYSDFENPKIVYPDIAKESRITFDESGTYFGNTAYIIPTTDKYLLAVLNSKLIFSYYKRIASILGDADKGGRLRWFSQDVLKLPIPNITPAEQQPFIALADELLTGHRTLHEADAAFAALLRAELGLGVPLTGKLALGPEWKPWSTALQKALGRPLTLAEKGEWLPHYTQHQQQQAQRRQHLAARDAQLDQLVYALYGLSKAEIALVEGREVAAT